MSRPCLVAIGCLLIVVHAAEARADWLIIPFLGSTLRSQTTLFDPEFSAGATKKLVVGASGVWLSDGLLGFEGEVSYAPGFFERDNQGDLVVGSSVSTLTGSAILTTPLSFTRESLRPYLAGGIGLLHASIDDVRNVFTVDSDLLAVTVGGGAIGFVTKRTGVRFDLRHVRSVGGDAEALTGLAGTRLAFWRVTVGAVLAY